MNKCVLKKTLINIWDKSQDFVIACVGMAIILGSISFVANFPIPGCIIVGLFILYVVYDLIRDSYKKAVDQCK